LTGFVEIHATNAQIAVRGLPRIARTDAREPAANLGLCAIPDVIARRRRTARTKTAGLAGRDGVAERA